MDQITVETYPGETTKVRLGEKIATLTKVKDGETCAVQCVDRATVIKNDLSGTTRTKPGKGHK